MRISDHFKNEFFRADDFTSTGEVFVISSVEIGKAGREEKLILHFEDAEKTLPLNKTNAMEISELLGDDTDDWTGKPIRIYQTKTEFNGKRVPCMRVSAPLESASPGKAATATKAKGSGSGSGSSKEVPF